MSNRLVNFLIIAVLLNFGLSICAAYTLFFKADGGMGATLTSIFNNLASPLFSFITILLLLYTSRIDHIKYERQERKNEVDLVLSLFSQLEDEISTFYYSVKKASKAEGEKELKYQGQEALNKWINDYCFGGMTGQYPYNFEDSFSARQFIQIVSSFKLLKKRIEIARFPDDTSEMIQAKLLSFYSCRLSYSVTALHFLFKYIPNVCIPSCAQIEQLYEEYNEHMIFSFKDAEDHIIESNKDARYFVPEAPLV